MDRTISHRALRRIVRTGLLALAAGFVLLFTTIMLFEESFIYFPSKFPEGDYEAPARNGVPIEEVFFPTTDGVNLHGWFLKGEGTPLTILFFHGNAGNLSDRYDWIVSLSRLPANVFAVDYRGYGRSEGKPAEKGLYLDAEAAYRWLTETRRIPAAQIVLYGKSLGGAPACELASRFPCGGLILQSTFTNAKDMGRKMMPIVPAFLIRTSFDNLGKVAAVSAPKLFIHSRDDEMIPVEMAERLHDAAPEPKTLALFEDAGHNDLIWTHRDLLLDTFRTFLSQVFSAPR